MNENIKKVFESKILIRTLYAIGIFVIAVIIFSIGLVAGFHKESFEHNWGEHYLENFGMMPPAPSNGMGMNYIPNAHGAVGKIINIALPNIIVQDKDGTEKVILTNDDTVIQKSRTAITSSDLRVDDFVVVIGTPDDKGVIEAKLIRIIPSPELLTQPN